MKNNSPTLTSLNTPSSSNQYTSQVSQSKEAHLVWLPKDMLVNGIGAFLSSEDKYNLSRASRDLHSIFKKDVSQHIHQFLTHVVCGDKKQVHAFLQKNPRLLLEKIKVTDHAGRKIYGTAYQIALGAKDVSPAPDEYDEMAEMIAAFFKMIPSGAIEKEKQYLEQFPEGFEEQEKQRKMQDREAVRTVFKKITHASSIATAEDAVEDFQSYMREQLAPVITSGYHFNEDIFQEAAKQYALEFSHHFDNNKFKKNLTYIKVLGFIQRFFTANLAQSACTGFNWIVNENKPITRSLLLNDDDTAFFDAQLGISHFVLSYQKCERSMSDRGWMSWQHHAFEKIMTKKNASLKKFAPVDRAHKNSWCHIS